MKLERRLNVYHTIALSGRKIAKYFWEHYDRNLNMVIACEIPQK